MRTIINIQKRRKVIEGKESVFYVRDKLVDQKKIDRFIQRKGLMQFSNSDLDPIRSQYSAYVECYTPTEAETPAIRRFVRGRSPSLPESSTKRRRPPNPQRKEQSMVRSPDDVPQVTEVVMSMEDSVYKQQQEGPISSEQYHEEIHSNGHVAEGASTKEQCQDKILVIGRPQDGTSPSIVEYAQIQSSQFTPYSTELVKGRHREETSTNQQSSSDNEGTECEPSNLEQQRRPEIPGIVEGSGSAQGIADPDLAPILKTSGAVHITYMIHWPYVSTIYNHSFASPHADSVFDSDEIKVLPEYTYHHYQPIEVSIPTSLHPLPDSLRSSSIKLFYFYHFLQHTARTMAAHDCLANPFKEILPRSKSCNDRSTARNNADRL